MTYFQVNEKCNGCLACVQNCPAEALRYVDTKKKRTISHNITRCARCGHCWRICPEKAIEFQHLLTSEWDDVVSLDIVLCKVCGEPLYTTKFRDTVNKDTKEEIEMLCPEHKKALLKESWKYKIANKNNPEMPEK